MADSDQDAAPSRLEVGEELRAGDVLASPNKQHALRLNEDGSLALLRDGAVRWQSGQSVPGAPAQFPLGGVVVSASLRDSGDLAVYGRKAVLGADKWPPIYTVGHKTDESSKSLVLEMRDDGVLVVGACGKVIWTSESFE